MFDVKQIFNLANERFVLNHNGFHGKNHWVRVYTNAMILCSYYNTDRIVPTLFSFLHDCCREDEGSDPLHGLRAASYADYLYSKNILQISMLQHNMLTSAMKLHSDGDTGIGMPLAIQICWDADRLDLGRVGKIPDRRYLCTEAAKLDSIMIPAIKRSFNQKSIF